jgi:hypothetical protein
LSTTSGNKPVTSKMKAPRTSNMKSTNRGLGGTRHPEANLAALMVGNVSAQRQAKWGSPRKKTGRE